MVVTVIGMGVVQVSVDEVIDMVAMRYRFVTATRTVHVARIVAYARMFGGALGRIRRVHVQCVIVDVVSVRMM